MKDCQDMPFSLEWDTEEKLGICVEVTGTYTWDDIWAMHNQTREMIDSVDHLVALYFVNGEYVGRNLPVGLITQGRNLYLDRHPRNHVTCYVNPKPSMVTRMWHQLLEKTIPGSIRFFRIVTSLEAARTVAAEVAADIAADVAQQSGAEASGN